MGRLLLRAIKWLVTGVVREFVYDYLVGYRSNAPRLLHPVSPLDPMSPLPLCEEGLGVQNLAHTTEPHNTLSSWFLLLSSCPCSSPLRAQVLGGQAFITISSLRHLLRHVDNHVFLSACPLIDFSQPKPVSQQCFLLIINQHQPAQKPTSEQAV